MTTDNVQNSAGQRQAAILEDVPSAARYLFFQLTSGAEPAQLRAAIAALEVSPRCVVGVGPALVAHLGGNISGLRELPVLSAGGVPVPSTPAALFCWLRGDDRGELLLLSRAIAKSLALAGLRLERAIDSFRYGSGRDLSGYEDGTENPEGDKAVATAFVEGQGAGLDGSSFVAVQVWEHDLDALDGLDQAAKDAVIGRRLSDNEEMDDAPETAHVKRTAQESYTPEAFVLRRSMPWNDSQSAGLVFVAFGHSLDAFEALLRRMSGVEDGMVDGLFSVTRPLTGSAFWCPPVNNGRLDLRALAGQA